MTFDDTSMSGVRYTLGVFFTAFIVDINGPTTPR
jgi:hypothetical protein